MPTDSQPDKLNPDLTAPFEQERNNLPKLESGSLLPKRRQRGANLGAALFAGGTVDHLIGSRVCGMSPGSALLSWRDLRSTPDRRSPVSCFSFSDRVSVPDRRSFETRLSSPDRFSSLPIVVSVGLPRIMLDRVILPHESRPGGLAIAPTTLNFVAAGSCCSRPRHQPCAAPLPSGHEPAVLSKISRHRGATPMTIIDSQVHAYEANTPKRPWHSVPNWPDHVTGAEMVAAMAKVGVDGAIFISAFSMYQYDASYAAEVQRAHPGRFALVKPVDPDDPVVADVIADWKTTAGTVGIRIMMTKEAKREPNDPGLDRILRAAVRHDFPVNILFWGNLDAGTALIDRHPDARF